MKNQKIIFSVQLIKKVNTKLLLLICGVLLIGTTAFSQNWNQIIKTVASDRGAGDGFANSIAISGNYAIVGAYAEDEDVGGANTLTTSGSAYVFERDGSGNWNEVQKIVASDRDGGDRFGKSVSISGNYAIIGAWGEDEDVGGANTLSFAGSAYVFERDGSGNWNEVQKIVASDRGTFDYFGYSVSISGNYAIVGANAESEDVGGANTLNASGSVYVFERDGSGNWNEVQKIVASDRAAQDEFGYSVSISGNYAIIGAWFEDEDVGGANTLPASGSAYVFERDGSGNWNEVQKIVSSDRALQDYFASSVSISGNYAIIGAWAEDEDVGGANTLPASGSAYVFERDGSGNWNEVQKIVASDRAGVDQFGLSVSISGNYAIVGARSEDEDAGGANTLSASGSAYVFERDGSGNWNEVQKIIASDRAVQDYFGESVSISGNYVIVGAPDEDEDEVGANTLSASGSAYVYELCTAPDLPTITTTTNTICLSGSSTLDWTGNILNDATAWEVYTGSCGVTSIGNTVGTTFIVSPIVTTTYYIRGEGGCATPGICSSITITVLQPSASTDIQVACDTYTWIDANTYTVSNNTATVTLTNAAGCDSVVTLDLTINNSNASTDTQVACDTYTWIDANTYTTNNNTATVTLTNVTGCDSVVTLDLTINNSNAGTDTQVACDTYTWIDANTYTTNNNTATVTLTNAAGCDSVVTLDLTINNSATGTDTRAECSGYVWLDGNTYNANNNTATFNITGGAANGCDSLVTLDLTINTVDTSITVVGNTMTASATGATFQWYDCSSGFVIIVGATNAQYTPPASGSYSVIVTQNGCNQMSSCIPITIVGINENTLFNNVSIYPNPNQGLVNINLGNLQGVSIKVFSMTGQLLHNEVNINTSVYQFELNEAKGIYFLEIESQGERKQFKLIKQ